MDFSRQDLATLYAAAQYSYWVYSESLSRFPAGTIVREVKDLKYCVVPGEETCWVVARGSVNLKNWYSRNLQFNTVSQDILGRTVRFHEGFRAAATTLLPDVIGMIPWGSDKPVSLCGHSLGGATASNLSMMLAATGTKIGSVVTLGAPRFFDDAGMEAHTELGLDEKLWRIVHDDDVVPTTPPASLGARHPWAQSKDSTIESDRTIILSDQTKVRRGSQFWDMVSNALPLTTGCLESVADRVEDHSMKHYVAGVKKLYQASVRLNYIKDIA